MIKKINYHPEGRWILSSLNVKEITGKYKDKYVGVRTENGKPVLILNTCRIKYTGTMEEFYD